MMGPLIVRNKNAILELLDGECKLEKIQIVNDLKQDDLTKRIVEMATKNKVPIEMTPFERMSKRREGESREVVVGYLIPTNLGKLEDLLDDLYNKKQDPFLLLINRVEFENNIGIIARTAFGAGVNGLIFQGDEDEFYNEETVHFSIGAIARIPVVKANIFEALKMLRKNDIKSYSLQMTGTSVYETDLRGGVALVLGSEARGVSEEVAKKCDGAISIPMKSGLDSLNVGISAGIVLYEKVRQEMIK